MKRITIFLLTCMMALVFVSTPAHAAESLSFNDRVGKAVAIVKGGYPDAELHEARGASITGLITNPEDIGPLAVIFDLRDFDITIYIQENENGDGQFGEPEILPGRWEDFPIVWPVEMDLDEANYLLQQDAKLNGYDGRYDMVTLEHPNNLPNPSFIFSRSEEVGPLFFIAVDTVTGKVLFPGESFDGGQRNAIVILGSQCLSLIKPKFSGGRWIDGNNRVDVFCDRRGRSPVFSKRATNCKSIRQDVRSAFGYVDRTSIACQEDKP